MVDWTSRELHIPRIKNEEPLHVPLNEAAIAALKVVFAGGEGTGRVQIEQDRRAARKRPSLV